MTVRDVTIWAFDRRGIAHAVVCARTIPEAIAAGDGRPTACKMAISQLNRFLGEGPPRRICSKCRKALKTMTPAK